MFRHRARLVGWLIVAGSLGPSVTPLVAVPLPQAPDVKACLERVAGRGVGGNGGGGTECARQLGPRSVELIPGLIDLLADAQTLSWDSVRPDGRMTGGSSCARDNAQSVLLSLGSTAREPLFRALATHPKPLVREGAAETLGRMDDDTAAAALVDALADETVVTGSNRTVDVLRSDGPQRVCDAAAGALASMKSSGDVLWTRAGTGTPIMRERMQLVLVRRGDARVVPVLTANLKSPSAQTRVNAATRLGRLSPPGLVDLLLPMLKDADYRVRAAAVAPLGRAALATASNDPQTIRIVQAIEAVARAADQEVTRRSRAYQNFDDVLLLTDAAREALEAIAARRK